MNSLRVLLAVVLLGGGLSTEASATNFVIFLADDLGWGDLACYGHPRIQTPNLDRFASEGMRFTRCYSASAVCSPSRSSILTGRTPYRNGVYRWIPQNHAVHLRETEITVARLLQERGYQTCHVGKWHLNGHFNTDLQPQPDDHGYDWWFATQNNAAPSHKDPQNFVRNGKEVGPLQGFSAPLVADEAIDWLKNHRDDKSPFFLTVWTHEPHLPIETDPEFQEPYEDLGEDFRQHHGNVSQLDHAFGNLMRTLDELELTEDTFVFFTSDNGPEGTGDRGRTRGSTGGLRGRKRDVFEGGIRVPGIARWPGRIQAGTENAQPVIGSDLFSTVCAIAGVPVPTDRTIDGASILPALRGEPIARELPLYWRCRIAGGGLKVAMRQGDWKILAPDDLSRFELYHLGKDPTESTELSATEPDRLAKMSEQLIALQGEIESEGPDWWKTLDLPKPPAPLTQGTDETGEFDVVLGGSIKKGEVGYEFSAPGEALALCKFPEALIGPTTFKVQYRTLKSSGTRNAALVFGSQPTNAATVKCGTGIGMGTHLLFPGSWNQLDRTGKKHKPEAFDPDSVFNLAVTIDPVLRQVRMTVDGQELSMAFPDSIKDVLYVGYYVKDTTTTFSNISRHWAPGRQGM